jgi:hypothetical protein
MSVSPTRHALREETVAVAAVVNESIKILKKKNRSHLDGL